MRMRISREKLRVFDKQMRVCGNKVRVCGKEVRVCGEKMRICVVLGQKTFEHLSKCSNVRIVVWVYEVDKMEDVSKKGHHFRGGMGKSEFWCQESVQK